MNNNMLVVNGEYQYMVNLWKNGINQVNGLLNINYIHQK